jgi:hypothetical protein
MHCVQIEKEQNTIILNTQPISMTSSKKIAVDCFKSQVCRPMPIWEARIAIGLAD